MVEPGGTACTIAMAAVLVGDYDEAIAWYTGRLGFALLEDTPLDGGKRWVRVAPASFAGVAPASYAGVAPAQDAGVGPGGFAGNGSGAGEGFSLLLARAATPGQESRIGNQTGGRVFLFLHTRDFEEDYRRLKDNGVNFLEEPRREPYGTVAVFEDLYGNKWDLVQPKTGANR